MFSRLQGQLWNASKIASGLGVSSSTANHYLDILEDTFMLRRLKYAPVAHSLHPRKCLIFQHRKKFKKKDIWQQRLDVWIF